MSYLAIVERVNQSWNAYVPDLPGCVAAAGTHARVEELIREAVPRHVALLRSRGETVPEPSSQTIEIGSHNNRERSGDLRSSAQLRSPSGDADGNPPSPKRDEFVYRLCP